MDLTEKQLDSKILYTGRIVRVRLDHAMLHNGKEVTREVVEHPGGVTILPLDENGDVVMVRQFRYPFSEETLELPAGKLDPNESHFECGLRELREETGLIPSQYSYLGCIYCSPGFCNEVLHLYLARSFIKTEMDLDEDEFLSVEKLPFGKVVDLIMKNEIRDAKTVAAIFKAKQLLGL